MKNFLKSLQKIVGKITHKTHKAQTCIFIVNMNCLSLSLFFIVNCAFNLGSLYFLKQDKVKDIYSNAFC